MSRLAVHPDEPTALLDDPVHRGQAKPGALPQFLGGEERLEDPGPRLISHPDAGVAHRQQREPTRHGRPVGSRIELPQLDRRGLQGQLAALRHGIPGVDRKVHDDLLELAGVDLDCGRRLAQHRNQLHVLADQALEHLLSA